MKRADGGKRRASRGLRRQGRCLLSYRGDGAIHVPAQSDPMRSALAQSWLRSELVALRRWDERVGRRKHGSLRAALAIARCQHGVATGQTCSRRSPVGRTRLQVAVAQLLGAPIIGSRDGTARSQRRRCRQSSRPQRSAAFGHLVTTSSSLSASTGPDRHLHMTMCAERTRAHSNALLVPRE